MSSGRVLRNDELSRIPVHEATHPLARPALLLPVNRSDVFEQLVQVRNDAAVAHQDLSFGVGHDHERQRRDLEAVIDLAFFIRDYRKGDMELFFVGGDLGGVVCGRNTQYLDILAQGGVFFDCIEQPINYRRRLLAFRSECGEKIHNNEFAGNLCQSEGLRPCQSEVFLVRLRSGSHHFELGKNSADRNIRTFRRMR